MNPATRTNAPAADTPIRREISVESKVINEADGIVEYVASDETLDSYNEIVRANGWRFDRFSKNAPFVDSHDYSSITKLLGKVTEFRVDGAQLIERVQYSREPGTLAEWAFKMVRDGFLKAVSVGFIPTRMASKFGDRTLWIQSLAELGLHEESGVRAIYLEQQQIELSQCVIGANPNALARAYKAGTLSDEDLDNLSRQIATTKTAAPATDPAAAVAAIRRAQLAKLAEIQAQL